jgi:hypothetical protein
MMRPVRTTTRNAMKPDINHVLKVYLGTDESGGYEPLYREERMRQAFPDAYSRKMALLAPYLAADQERDWTVDLVQDRDRFEATLRQNFPELDPIIARALANRWSFDWR